MLDTEIVSTADVSPADIIPPSYRLYTPIQVGFAAMMGGPSAACWLLAHNYRQLGERKLAMQFAVGGVVGTLAAGLLSYALASSVPGPGLSIVYTIALYHYAKRYQEDSVLEHCAAGGRLGSWWAVVGIGTICLIVVLAAIIGVILTSPSGSFQLTP